MDKNKDTDFFETLKDKKGFMDHLRNSFNVFKKEKSQDKDYIYKLFYTLILNAVQTFKNNLEEFKEVIDTEGDNFLLIDYPIEIKDWNNISIKDPIDRLKKEDFCSEEAISINASKRFFRYFELRFINHLNNNAGMLIDKEKWIPIQFDDVLDKYRKLTEKEYKEILNSCRQDSLYRVDIKGNIKTDKEAYKKYEGAFFVDFGPFLIDKDIKMAFQVAGVRISINSGYKLKNWTLKDLEKQTERVISKLKKKALDDSYGFKFKLPDNFLARPLEDKKQKALIRTRFKKYYISSDLIKLSQTLFKTQKLNKKDGDHINEYGEATEVWESKGVEYLIRVNDLPKLEGKPPKVYVSQFKNISLIMAMIQEQQYSELNKKAECRFSLPYYAERRGYSKEEIEKGGNFFNELKRDLFTGAYTTYRIDKVIIEDKEYTAHGIPNFYILFVPKNPKVDWFIELNEPYKSWELQILHGKAKQYFIKNPKAIEDRETTKKPYLFLFYMQLVRRRRKELITTPVKIGNLLKDMKLPEKILISPKRCFEVLKGCLIYFSQNYPPVPELESFNLFNDFHRTETVRLPLSISEAFEKYSYADFKDLIKAIGIKDIREAYITFRRPHIKPKHKLNEEEKELLERTLNWFDGQVTKIPLEDQKSLVEMYIKKIGYENYKRLFEVEANKLEANAVEFLTKVLPDKLRRPTDA